MYNGQKFYAGGDRAREDRAGQESAEQGATAKAARNWRVCRQGRRGQGRVRQGRAGQRDRSKAGIAKVEQSVDKKQGRA